MEHDYVTNKEFSLYMEKCDSEHKRLEDEDKRQNKRIDVLEETIEEMRSLSISIEKLASNMDGMLKELERQGKRLGALESRDGEMWRKVVGFALSALVGGIVVFALSKLGM